MTLSKRYSAEEVEKKWYKYWIEKGYFKSKPDEREAYSIVIPPPNVTGVLHMGHLLNSTIQDVLIRKARLEGKNACWVPGIDHASIATEARVVKMLHQKGIKKSTLNREEFLKYAFEWKDKYGGIILDQLQRLGASCDWDRIRFTMEHQLSAYVVQVFVNLYEKGYLYRGLRMTNWDCEAQTVLSNEEVVYKEEDSKLYYIRYKIEGADNEWLTIATTRPETILGDSAIAIHPKDERYTHLRGKRALVPMVNRSVPIIFDSYVKMDFGTGALKVTPAHDMNDYEIGKRHGLETIDILSASGRVNTTSPFYVGMTREKAREQIVVDLKAQGYWIRTENYKNNVGRSERTGVVVEPRLTEQWFLAMKDFAASALNAVENAEVKFYPRHMINMYRTWLKPENVRDWCISRQLWWGQQIPAWYLKADKSQHFVAETEQAALAQARKKMQNAALSLEDLVRDDDVVDTWFSSWLWPISVFDGFGEDKTEFKYYYPTNALVTGWDIIFFWVARMIMAGYEWAPELLGAALAKKKGVFPFKEVYFTGMVRDSLGRKMSKSLGNSPDSMELLKKYGADGVRFGILSAAAAGNDIIFDAPFKDKTKTSIENESKLCEVGRNFTSKIWNAKTMLKKLKIRDKKQNNINTFACKWMEQRFNKMLHDVNRSFASFHLSDATRHIREGFWDNFCAWFIELIKPAYYKDERGTLQQESLDRTTYDFAVALFEKLLTVLHPFMPFITEEVWAELKNRKEGEDCIVSQWPKVGNFNEQFLYRVEIMKDLVTRIRNLRNRNQLKQKDLLGWAVLDRPSASAFFEEDGLQDATEKIAYLRSLQFVNEEPADGNAFIAGTEQYYLIFRKEVSRVDKNQLLEELAYQRDFEQKIQKKLANERFVNHAPVAVVDRERKKLADIQAKIKLLELNLASLDELKHTDF